MKTTAAVLYETNGDLVLEELETPALQKGQVLVKILSTGICRSQINEIKAHKGPDKFLPHLLGHEAAGIVEELGPGVTKVSIGDKVILTWIKGAGYDVPSCSYTGKKAKVNSGAITTFNSHSVVSENRLVKYDVDLPLDIAPLFGCAIPTGVGIVQNQLGVQEGESVAVFGVGGIGSAVVLGALARKAIVVAVDISDQKLSMAKELGAQHVVNAKDDVASFIGKLGGVDYAIDCSGNIKAIEQAFSVLKDSGTLVIAGNPAAGETMRVTPFDFIKGKRIIGSWGGASNPDTDIPRYIEQYLAGKLRVDLLRTTAFPLSEINAALAEFERGEFSRVLLHPQ